MHARVHGRKMGADANSHSSGQVSSMRDVPRLGSGTYPLPIFGHYCYAVSRAIYLIVVEVQTIINNAFCLPDVLTFLGTPTGPG